MEDLTVQERSEIVEAARASGGDNAAELADNLLPKPSVDRLLATYIKIRDAKAAATAAYEKKDKLYKEQMEMIENELLARAEQEGVSGFKTPHGAAYVDVAVMASGADWDIVYNWIKENDAFDMMERRIKSTFVKKYMDEHDGVVPPGVNVFTQRKMKVRRA